MDRSEQMSMDREKLMARAAVLALITIAYNIVEGVVSVIFGMQDDTLSLFGFGLDSFVEVISGMGIWHMVRRMRRKPEDAPDRYEQRALKITGSAFYVLSAGLGVTALLNLVQGHHPETTIWGVFVGAVSILTMGFLIHYKKNVGTDLGSDAILADANCTKACLYLSVALLVASVGYEWTHIGGLDALGALWIAWYAFKEGREAFEKSQGKPCSCASCGTPPA